MGQKVNKKIIALLSAVAFLTLANTVGIFFLLHRQEKNRLEQESKQAAFQEEMSQNLSESFISLQAYLMDSFAEQHSLLQKTNSIARQKKTAQAEQTAVISKDMSEGLSLMAKKEYAQAKAIFDKVVALQPYNNEAKFYSVYALFLQNKIKQSNYKLITDTFSSLRGAGYSRIEMEEVESFIKGELESMKR